MGVTETLSKILFSFSVNSTESGDASGEHESFRFLCF